MAYLAGLNAHLIGPSTSVDKLANHPGSCSNTHWQNHQLPHRPPPRPHHPPQPEVMRANNMSLHQAPSQPHGDQRFLLEDVCSRLNTQGIHSNAPKVVVLVKRCEFLLRNTYLNPPTMWKDSLWVKWIHTYKIRECNFWDIPCRGRLPVKYLGVLLVPSRLIYKDCKELIEKVDGRINDWKNKSLSIAGRLQLIHSVISSLHVYWASMFVLPSGNGQSVSFWYDNWCSLSPLADLVSTREMYRAGLTTTSNVSDLMYDRRLVIPNDLLLKYPILHTLNNINMAVHEVDKIEWRVSRIVKSFVVSTVWMSIRPRDTIVNWADVV
nr:reverse transcriptase domain, reverse transcriptase zinc-binding domain protein [Tanacetum cinerariifolium]